MMKKCKITILKTTLQKELAEEYGVEGGWYFNDWIDPKHKGVAICSCNDGLRPVIIKIERTDEDDNG